MKSMLEWFHRAERGNQTEWTIAEGEKSYEEYEAFKASIFRHRYRCCMFVRRVFFYEIIY